MDSLKEPKEEPLFDNEIAHSVVQEKEIKEEEMSNDEKESHFAMSSYFSPPHSVDRSRSHAPEPVEVKEEEMEAEAPIVEKKKKLIHKKAKDSRVTNEGDNRRRSSRNVSRPKNYPARLNDSDDYNEPSIKKSRSAADKSGESDSMVIDGARKQNTKDHAIVTPKPIPASEFFELQKKVVELQQTVHTLEKSFQGVHRIAVEAQARVQFLEKFIDTTPKIENSTNDEDKKNELEKNKPKIQPNLGQRKVEESEESSEEEYEDEYDSEEEEESDGIVQSDDSDSEQSVVINPCKCEETLVKKHADPLILSIVAKFIGISKLSKDSIVYSTSTVLAGITWRINMQTFIDGGLTFSLEGENKGSSDWFCPVEAELLGFSLQEKAFVHKTITKCMFDADKSSTSIGFLTYKDLFDKEKGYVISDSLFAAVKFKVYPKSLNQAKDVPIRAKFTEISKLTEDEVHSEPVELNGNMWKMNVKKDKYDQYLFNLHGEAKADTSWWCPVIAELRLLSQNTGKIVHITKKNHSYDAGHHSRRLAKISYKDLFDDDKGFVNDDSIVVDVIIKAFPIN